MAGEIDNGFEIDKPLSFDGETGIFWGTTDPSVSGEVAPIGSLYIRNNSSSPEIWQKVGVSNNNWALNESYAPPSDNMFIVSSPNTGDNWNVTGGTLINFANGSGTSHITYDNSTSIISVVTTGSYNVVINSNAVSASKKSVGVFLEILTDDVSNNIVTNTDTANAVGEIMTFSYEGVLDLTAGQELKLYSYRTGANGQVRAIADQTTIILEYLG